MPAVLNLNNEVVKLRAEVKRVRVLIIRKLIRQISVLGKKKGSQEDLERHRRRAARLLEEIQELKVLVPDKVTKAALQKDISFEDVCKNKEASMSDRAIARIATHPQFNKKIQSLKDTIKAFKDERINEIKSEKQAKKKADNIQDQPQEDSDDEGPEKIDEEKKVNEEEGDDTMDNPYEDSNDQEVLLKMRREVKSIRVLVLGKLTHKIAVLKKKKGAESEVKKNQEMVAELTKDIQALRSLKPDQPTMTALKQNVELEEVLQNPKASPMDRVIAHIVTHSRFINKLQKVMNTIEEKRAKASVAEQMKTEREKNDGMTGIEREEDDGEEDEDDREEEDDSEEDEDADAEEEDDSDEDGEDDQEEEDDSEEDKDDDKEEDNEEKDDDEVGEEKLRSLSIEIHRPAESTDSGAVKLPPIKMITTPEKSRATKVKSPDTMASKSSSEKSSNVSNTASELQMNMNKTDIETETTIMRKAPSQKEDEESDVSDNDEEKEYFDDSTEERFRRQSSQSEESDDDDFFLSKVSKFKKRKSSKPKVHRKESESQTSDMLQNVAKAKPQETNLGKLGSVFCSTLSKSPSQKHGSRHDGPRPPRFQNQRGHEGRMKPSIYKHQGTDRRAAPFKPNKQMFTHAGKRPDGPPGAGRGRSQFEQHQNHNPRGPSGKISNPPQQSLHPSWEASRKRKEQQAQIPAFQGKKIRFDDDD